MSISLNGSDSNYLSLSGGLGIQGNQDRSFCCWAKPANTNAYKQLWRIAANDSSSRESMFFYSDATILPSGSSGAGSSMRTYSADVWYFVYARNSGSNNANSRYGSAASGLDDVTDLADSDYACPSSAATDFAQFRIGNHSATSAPWNGEICCFRVWTAQLSAAEMYAECKSATPVRTSNLLMNWRLANNSDLSSTVNSYTLTAVGTVSTGSTEPSDISGAAGGVPKTSKLTLLGVG